MRSVGLLLVALLLGCDKQEDDARLTGPTITVNCEHRPGHTGTGIGDTVVDTDCPDSNNPVDNSPVLTP